MIGLEALSLQGLPVDKLLLTRETEDQLADLAGNAMSTTVVGASIMAAMVVGKKLLRRGPSDDDAQDAMEVDVPSATVKNQITGEDQLCLKPLDLATTTKHSLPSLLEKAERSARLCDCEGRTGVASRVVRRCQDCGTTSCIKCGGRPEHNYQPINLEASPRLPPNDFSAELKAALPMCLSIHGVDEAYLEEIKKASDTIEDDEWNTWKAAVLAASQSELRFAALKRQEIWVATYSSRTASLELLLHPKRAEWRLFGEAEASVPANSSVRKLLSLPIARFICRDGLLDGVWEFALPRPTSFKLEIKGVGDLVPAWESKLGLLGAAFKERLVHVKVQIAVPEEHISALERNISGVYTYLPQCGAANSSLHLKLHDDPSLPDLFFFIDPTRCGDVTEDAFVFSISKRRYEFGETRPIICRLNPKWRQTDTADAEIVDCHVPCFWVPAANAQLQVRIFVASTFYLFPHSLFLS